MSINHQSIIDNEKSDLQLNQSRVPDLPARLGKVGRSVYSQLLHRLANYKGEIYPLHVGDTYLPPAVSMSMIDQVEDHSWRAHLRCLPYTINAGQSLRSLFCLFLTGSWAHTIIRSRQA